MLSATASSRAALVLSRHYRCSQPDLSPSHLKSTSQDDINGLMSVVICSGPGW
jgi:hypothetical protein